MISHDASWDKVLANALALQNLPQYFWEIHNRQKALQLCQWSSDLRNHNSNSKCEARKATEDQQLLMSA